MLSNPNLELLFLSPSLFFDIERIGDARGEARSPIDDELLRLWPETLLYLLIPPEWSTDLNYQSFLLLALIEGILDIGLFCLK
jgi:hypothetical protein